MKVLFVQPGFVNLTNEYPPIGVLYLASVARGNAYDVDLFDASAEGRSLEQAFEYFVSYQPDILAVSLYTIGIVQQFDFLGKVKRAGLQCTVVAGGPHATALPVETMKACREIDYLVFGEGEETMLELFRAIESIKPVNEIKGICYRDGEDVKCSEKRELIKDLNTIPFPAFDLIRKHNFSYAKRAFEMFTAKGAIITSRGCPAKCEFCFKATFGKRLRRRSPKNVVAEMIWQMKEFDVKEFQFVDDLFAIGSKWLKGFFNELEENNIHIPWKCLSRVNTVKEDDIREMKKHGCYGIEFGVESGNNEILKDIKKNITLDQVRWAFNTSRRHGLLTFGFFIFGHRMDTHDSIKETMKFAKEIRPDMPGFAILLPFPGSGVYKYLDEGISRNWSLFSSYYDKTALPLSICSVSAEDLRKYSEQAEAELYGSYSFMLYNVFFRRGIRDEHRKELFYRSLTSLKRIDELDRSNKRVFSDGPSIPNSVLNRTTIIFAEIFIRIKGLMNLVRPRTK